MRPVIVTLQFNLPEDADDLMHALLGKHALFALIDLVQVALSEVRDAGDIT